MELLPSDLNTIVSAKTPHDVEVYQHLTKEALMGSALKMWKLSRHVITDDDGICEAMKNSLDAALAEGKRETARMNEAKVDFLVDEVGRAAAMQGSTLAQKKVYAAELRERINETSAELLTLQTVQEAVYFHSLVAYADGQISAIGLSRWAENGFPQVTMGHKYCAALLCTGADAATITGAKAPWSSFFIEVPPGMLPVQSLALGRDVEVKRILVTRLQNKKKGETWGYVAFTETTLSLWRFGAENHELEPPSIEGEEHYVAGQESEEFTTQDRRVVTLIGRLIINTCLAMSDASSVAKIGPGHKSYAAARNKKDEREPIVRTFQVGQPVTLDLRDQVKTFILRGSRKGTAPNVQVIVRGHFKTQRHGPKNALIKTLWRQPFRRGPMDAPFSVRTHQLKKEEADGG